MSIISFLNIGMHGYINPTLPVVAELVRRGHSVTYHTFPAFAAEIEAAGADVYPYSMGNPLSPEPIPVVPSHDTPSCSDSVREGRCVAIGDALSHGLKGPVSG